MNNRKKYIIAGPCALESREQLRESVQALKPYATYIRASLWKPRTRPGWEGYGKEGIKILLEETIPHQLIPATELMMPEHAEDVVHELNKFGTSVKMFLWIGARNQNHIIIHEIAKILADSKHDILLMIKNQPWPDPYHWIGLVQHVAHAGFPKEKILLCHRGFYPYSTIPNPDKFRNIPDFELVMDVRNQIEKDLGVAMPVIIDPSHIGGSPENVKKAVSIMVDQNYPFDGLIVEVHPDREKAKTDATQQLYTEEFIEVFRTL